MVGLSETAYPSSYDFLGKPRLLFSKTLARVVVV
jgi:hypothetical protein